MRLEAFGPALAFRRAQVGKTCNLGGPQGSRRFADYGWNGLLTTMLTTTEYTLVTRHTDRSF